MCQFFSFVTKGSKRYYFDWPQRQELLKNNPKGYEPDSHSSIIDFYGLDEKVNNYEYNPLTKVFQVDQINIKDDQALAKRWVQKFDFKKVCEPLIIKEIVNPLKISPPEITEKHIELLKEWASVRDSVSDSVWDSVRDSVRDSVGVSVRDSVWDSVRVSIWVSVRDSVRVSVWDSVWAYYSSFFRIEKCKGIDHEPFKNPFQPAIDLWEQGLVASYYGTTWRLHGGEKAAVLYELKKEKDFKRYYIIGKITDAY
jgi:hypothetical protein